MTNGLFLVILQEAGARLSHRVKQQRSVFTGIGPKWASIRKPGFLGELAIVRSGVDWYPG